MKKQIVLALGLLAVMVTSLLGSSAWAHSRNDYRGNDRNGWFQSRRVPVGYFNRGNGWGNRYRQVAYHGNRWNNNPYNNNQRRGWFR